MAELNVAVLVGSLRRESLTRRVARTFVQLAPPSLRLREIAIGDLPLYNPDREDDLPSEWRRFRDEMRGVDAVIFTTPEYNRSVPGCLKNAIDVGSRPFGQSVFTHKPAAVVSVSPGMLGAFGANHHLRQMLVFLDMPTLQQPEVYLSGVGKMYEGDELTSESTREFLAKFMAAFAAWCDRVGES